MASNTKSVRFGPGQYESLTLRITCRRRQEETARLRANLEGTYTVYCGNGSEHQVAVKEMSDIWTSESGDEARLVAAAYGGDVDAAHELAGLLVDFALEDYIDPCDN